MTTLQRPAYALLPVRSIKPHGWLRDQLQLQANGLTGHLDEFWPSVKDSKWIGGSSEGWERGPYWLDGLIPLAFLLDDEKLLAKAKYWVDTILAGQHADGWLGSKDDARDPDGNVRLDPWPLFVVFKAFLGWHDGTGDERIVPALLNCAKRIGQLLDEEPLWSWAWVRWADFVWSLHRLHDLSGEEWLLDLAATVQKQGFDWRDFFEEMPCKTKSRPAELGWDEALKLHGVNNAMALKNGAVWWRQSGEEADKASTNLGLGQLDKYHGAVSGMFNADEHLAGRSPAQGFETCAIVEAMFSLEVAGVILGDATLFDRLEQIAFNALPASTTADFWAHQYHQQTNQVLCSLATRDWTDSGPRANLFGQDVNFGCCQANLHQGWPKFAQSLWGQSEATLASLTYAPCEIDVTLGGQQVKITETTDYPFRGEVRFDLSLDIPVSFTWKLRLPAWCKNFRLYLNRKILPAQNNHGWLLIERQWEPGDVLELILAMPVRVEERPGDTIALHRGPLLLALPIDEEYVDTDCPYTAAEPRAREFEIKPLSPWNWALPLENGLPILGDAEEQRCPSPPFARDGAAVSVSVRAHRISNWGMENNSATAPPAEPVAGDEPAEKIELVPYGCARLRVAEFPVLK